MFSGFLIGRGKVRTNTTVNHACFCSCSNSVSFFLFLAEKRNKTSHCSRKLYLRFCNIVFISRVNGGWGKTLNATLRGSSTAAIRIHVQTEKRDQSLQHILMSV